MYDRIIRKGNSLLQHGPANDRIYLISLAKEDMPEILDTLDEMASTYGYSKIFAKVPEAFSAAFLKNEYVIEAMVPGFYNGKSNCILMGKYMNEKRNIQVDTILNKDVVERALSKKAANLLELNKADDQLPSDFTLKKAEYTDIYQMVKLYSKVFDSYPFPIFDPAYIRKTMDSDIVYFSIWKGDEIVALSSCEMYVKDESVEMTDFAVIPAYRGYNFSYFLLNKMEKEMKKNKIKTAYTIARSCSYGMNSTFAKAGYNFSGILAQNTQIGGKIEDMNVWYKSLE